MNGRPFSELELLSELTARFDNVLLLFMTELTLLLGKELLFPFVFAGEEQEVNNKTQPIIRIKNLLIVFMEKSPLIRLL